MQRRLSLLNLFSVLLVITVNYISQAIRFNETTIGEVSNKYFNLFTPEGYAFAIWGLIFIALIAYGGYQVKLSYTNKTEEKSILKTAYWFVIANFLNCVWVFVFAYEYTGISVLVMLGILIALIKIILNTNMALAPVSRSTYFFNRLPIGIYSGWIAVATIANIAAYLAKLNWEGSFLSETGWTITMIIIATILNLIVLYTRKMYEFAVVGIWALFAIYIRHQHKYETIAYTALIGCLIILVAIIGIALKHRKNSVHISTT
ncbi:tryptophan-rich sensory protein [Aurantibacter sp.]|uniref:tryptophan-rich sensory protein n=1 Tax=Aurantibacter sp. TaxID=2807103 RepID=UPI003264310B